MNSYTCKNSACNSLQKWDIGNRIRTIVAEDETLQEMVGDNVYPIVAPENTPGDFIVYRRESYAKTVSKMGTVSDRCTVALTVVSDDYDSSVAIAQALDDALVGTHGFADGEIEYKFEMSLEDSTETYDDDKYIQTLLFDIR